MKTLLIKVTSQDKAEMLAEMLKDLNFVTDVTMQPDEESQAKEEHEAMKQMAISRKNKAFAKYLE